MNSATSPATSEGLSNRLEAKTERLLREVDSDSDETLTATAAELWDVVDEFEPLLETIDFEKLPDAVELSALTDFIDLEGVPAAIRDRDPDAALDFDLDALRRAIHLRQLWNTVDLVDFRSALRRVNDELEDVVGADALASSGGSEAATQLSAFVDDVADDATNAAIQQQAMRGQKAARKGVIDGHETVERLYESMQRGPGYAGRRPVSNNPTAVSSVPYGPLPASVSTRVSTVPTNVRGAKVDALPRIYSRRWQRVGPSR
ncbi:hypothetical protein AB7C87_05695 [Natrarchaeobius sp. A-rgal3]|uniref:hypothetical protein n=1 Tax=Natrarchaeobius versutus TaxID=1679078 RepID=UPI00351033B5